MKQITFSYTTKLTFDDDVHDHSFALRIIPPDSPVQKLLQYDLHITPLTQYCQTVDAFGNHVISGYINEPHRFLDFTIKGRAEVDLSQSRTDFLPCYRYPSELTKPDASIQAFFADHRTACDSSDPAACAAFWSELLSDTLRYEKGVTCSGTTAAEVMAAGAGVCQDFSHLLISFLRLHGIPARYMAGLAYCNGETHAWVEYWNADHWEGIDPSNNCPVSENYLVLSQGRDFADCSINRGVMLGNYTQQMQLVRSVLS
ncbi:MAG: transglutaminase family protein [Oscillospiraceae bacterium]|nr:transglutaminase family protein [Oscillospiraceae bacterium]